MSHSTVPLTPFVESPNFSTALDGLVRRICERPQLHACEHVTRVSFGGSGEFDEEYPCYSQGVVHDLATDKTFCLAHFFQTSLRRELQAVNRG